MFPTGTPVTLERFQEACPLTTKAELTADQRENPPYGSLLTRPLEAYTRCHQTSGTTGEPLRWLDTPESWAALVDDWALVFRMAGAHSADRIFFAFSFGPFIGFWMAFEAAQRLGALTFAGGGMSSQRRLRVLHENRCTVLCCTPTYALHLANVAREEGWKISDFAVRLLIVAGEPGGSIPSVRQRLSEAWNGATVHDHHGMTETGPATFEHPDEPGNLVIMGRSLLAEVIDPDTGQPVPDGHRGELVLTTLRRTDHPVLRYRTGDWVVARQRPEGCVLEGGILGRVDDMQVIRGVNVYPSAVDEALRQFADIQEYRVTCDHSRPLAEIEVEVELGREPGLPLGKGSHDRILQVESKLRESVGLRIRVKEVPVHSLPRFEMKAKRWHVVGPESVEVRPHERLDCSPAVAIAGGGASPGTGQDRKS
jgi:phenylacetate-CoA ligase